MSGRNTRYKELVTEKVVSFMEEHDKLARRQITELGCLGDDVFNVSWENLGKELNTIAATFGIPPKPTARWKNFWNDARLEARQRASEFLKHQVRSTGNIPNPIYLTDHEIRINAIFGKEGLGLSIIPEIGVKSSKNRVNPIDLFDEFFPKRKMTNPDATTVSELQKAEIVKIMAEPDNVKFALGVETDPQTRMKVITTLVTRLNDIKPGAVKDFSQWQNTYDNMWRHCHASISSNIDPNKFLTRVHNYRNPTKKNKEPSPTQGTLPLKEIGNEVSSHFTQQKRTAAKQPSQRPNKKMSIDEDLIARGFLPHPSVDVSTGYEKSQTGIDDSSATANKIQSFSSPRTATVSKDMFSTYQADCMEIENSNVSTSSKAPSSSLSRMPEPNSSFAGTSTSTNISKQQYNNNSAANSTSQGLIDGIDTYTAGKSTAGMTNVETMQSFTHQNESTLSDKPQKLADITVEEFRKILREEIESILNEKLVMVEDTNQSSQILNDDNTSDNQSEKISQIFTNQKQQSLPLTSLPTLILKEGDYVSDKQLQQILASLNSKNKNKK